VANFEWCASAAVSSSRLTAIARLLGDELNLQFDGSMEIDHDLISSIAAVAEDVEAGRIAPDPDGPDWIILARDLSKIRRH
jgi:hypothetical protein